MDDEFREVDKHRLYICRNKHSPRFCCQLQYLWIWSAVGDDADMAFKIDARFATAKSAPDIRIDVRVGLKPDFQATFGALPLLARSNGSSISGGNGWLA